MRWLSSFERRWLLDLFDVLLPAGLSERLPDGARTAPLGGFIDELLRLAPLSVVLGLRGCLWLVVLSPLGFGQLRTFVQLRAEEKLALIERLGQSRVYFLRETPLFFKMLVCMAIGGLPRVHQSFGIEPRDASPPSWADVGTEP